MIVRASLGLASICFLCAAGKPQFRELNAVELAQLIRGAEIISGDNRAIVEIFEKDGSYRRLTSSVSDRGSYVIENNSICTLAIRKFCRAVVTDGDGDFYYVNRIGVLRRPYRIRVERKQGSKI